MYWFINRLCNQPWKENIQTYWLIWANTSSLEWRQIYTLYSVYHPITDYSQMLPGIHFTTSFQILKSVLDTSSQKRLVLKCAVMPYMVFSEYPGLICGCQIVWMCDWPKENLLEEASYYVKKYKLGSDCEADITFVYMHITSYSQSVQFNHQCLLSLLICYWIWMLSIVLLTKGKI